MPHLCFSELITGGCNDVSVAHASTKAKAIPIYRLKADTEQLLMGQPGAICKDMRTVMHEHPKAIESACDQQFNTRIGCCDRALGGVQLKHRKVGKGNLSGKIAP